MKNNPYLKFHLKGGNPLIMSYINPIVSFVYTIQEIQ